MKEISELEGFEEYKGYYVTTCGKIISNKRNTWKNISLFRDNNGYNCVRVYNKPNKKCYRVHRLVALAFLPKIEGKKCINHIDEIKHNSYITNLEWCTHKANRNHGTKNERQSRTYKENYYKSGVKTYNYRKIEYYEKNYVSRKAFKSKCKELELNINDFITVFSGLRGKPHKKNALGDKKDYYINKDRTKRG